MLMIRNYDVFCKVMEVATSDLYRIMFRNSYDEALSRLRITEALRPTDYKEWLTRWHRDIKK